MSDFITPFVPLDKKKEKYYKLTDNFCLFYLNFIEKKGTNDEAFWQHSVLSPTITSWQGFAFEEVCFAHSQQIKAALGIAGIQTNISSLVIAKEEDQPGMQIDMLIERADRVINLCEIKYCHQEFVIDKNYEEKLRHRVERLRELTKNKRNIHLTLITTFGLHYNEYSGRIQKTVTLEDLFA